MHEEHTAGLEYINSLQPGTFRLWIKKNQIKPQKITTTTKKNPTQTATPPKNPTKPKTFKSQLEQA